MVWLMVKSCHSFPNCYFHVSWWWGCLDLVRFIVTCGPQGEESPDSNEFSSWPFFERSCHLFVVLVVMDRSLSRRSRSNRRGASSHRGTWEWSSPSWFQGSSKYHSGGQPDRKSRRSRTPRWQDKPLPVAETEELPKKWKSTFKNRRQRVTVHCTMTWVPTVPGEQNHLSIGNMEELGTSMFTYGCTEVTAVAFYFAILHASDAWKRLRWTRSKSIASC